MPKSALYKRLGQTRKTVKEKNLTTPFIAMAKELQGLARQAVSQYSLEVNAIIKGKSTDSRQIENILDGMLGFCFDESLLLLYKKLCRHYFGINPQATAFYVHAYRDMWDE